MSFAYTNEVSGERGPTVFSKVDLSATLESRICIVGENGAGKTTLLKLIMDQVSRSLISFYQLHEHLIGQAQFF